MKKMMTSTRMGKGHKHYKPIQEFTTINNLALDRKIKEAGIGLKPCTQHLLMELPTDECLLLPLSEGSLNNPSYVFRPRDIASPFVNFITQ
jgi:hypothetical protein